MALHIIQAANALTLQDAATSGKDEDGQQWLMVGKRGQQSLQIDGRQVDVLIAGICPRLDMQIAWLHLKLHHPDHFLYIVLHVH